MKRLRNKKGLLEALVVIGLILLIPLFFTMRTTAEQNAAPNTPAPPLPTVAVNAPQDSNALAPKQPPACTFPLAQTTTADAVPEEYVFSEPQVVLTADSSIDIVEWLPDNERALITQIFQDNSQQNIELFNPQTGEIQIYATRHRTEQHPKWMSASNAVLYSDTTVIKSAKANGMNLPPYEFQRQLWISRGDPKNAQLIEDDRLIANGISEFSIVVKPGKNQVVYRSYEDKKLSKRTATLTGLQSVIFDPSQWEHRKDFPQSGYYNMAWRPNASQILLYNVGDVGGYTFLFDADTGQICEIDLGSEGSENGWADIARWSPDGKYLAVIRTWGRRPVETSDLVVLNTMSGKLDEMKIIPPDIEGAHFVNDVAWAPDSQHLVAIAQSLIRNQTTYAYDKISNLYLVDFLSGQAHQIPSSNEKLGSGLGKTNLIWSDDGSQLLVKCPANQIDRLCLLSVQKNIQP